MHNANAGMRTQIGERPSENARTLSRAPLRRCEKLVAAAGDISRQESSAVFLAHQRVRSTLESALRSLPDQSILKPLLTARSFYLFSPSLNSQGNTAVSLEYYLIYRV